MPRSQCSGPGNPTRESSIALLECVVCRAAGLSHFIGSARWLAPVQALLARLMTRVQAETAAMVSIPGRAGASVARELPPDLAKHE
jgi:hypothetical protein